MLLEKPTCGNENLRNNHYSKINFKEILKITRKWVKKPEKRVHKSDTSNPSNMKRCSTSVIREMQTKTDLKYHFSPIRRKPKS